MRQLASRVSHYPVKCARAMMPLTGANMEAASKGGWWVYLVWDSHGDSRLCHAVPVI